MKVNLRNKIRDFLTSEEGAVGVKTPLAAGVAAGGLMILQAIVSTPDAQAYDSCSSDADCPTNYECKDRPFPVVKCCTLTYIAGTVTYAPYWSVEWHEVCVPK